MRSATYKGRCIKKKLKKSEEVREHQWDRHTVIVVVADLAVTMFLAGEVRRVVPVNLTLMQMLLFLVYSGARAWLQHLRAERLYF